MTQPVFFGCMPALMTPCDVNGNPDFDALANKGEELMQSGMSAVVYCGSMGDWPLLSDEQRMTGVEALVSRGVPVIVGTGAQNTQKAAALAKHAEDQGAVGLMVIPRVLSRGISPIAQYDHFKAVLGAAPSLPSVIYNSPYYGYETKADLFFKLHADHKNLVGFKEFGGAASLSYASEMITSGNPDLTLMVGVDTQVYHGFVNCGAGGAITGVGNALPREVLRLVELCERAAGGDECARKRAAELEEALAVLSKFDEGPDLVLYYKRLMVLEGDDAYMYQLNPTDALTPTQKAFLDSAWRQFRNWWAGWPGATD
ncbi:MAG: dihydrodipicolinate synthase family protein [Pseudomonadota bacterium]